MGKGFKVSPVFFFAAGLLECQGFQSNVEMMICSEKYVWDSWKTSVSVWCLELEIYYSLMKWYSIFNWGFYHGSPPILTINWLLNTPDYLRSSKFGCLKVASFEIVKKATKKPWKFHLDRGQVFFVPKPQKKLEAPIWIMQNNKIATIIRCMF